MALPEAVDITYASTLLKSMQGLASAQGDVVIDAQAATRVTTPCIQIFLAAAKSVKGKFIMREPSEAMVKAFCDLGLEEEINNWSDYK